MIFIIEGISWLEAYNSKIECANKLVCDYIDRNFERLLEKHTTVWKEKAHKTIRL